MRRTSTPASLIAEGGPWRCGGIGPSDRRLHDLAGQCAGAL